MKVVLATRLRMIFFMNSRAAMAVPRPPALSRPCTPCSHSGLPAAQCERNQVRTPHRPVLQAISNVLVD